MKCTLDTNFSVLFLLSFIIIFFVFVNSIICFVLYTALTLNRRPWRIKKQIFPLPSFPSLQLSWLLGQPNRFLLWPKWFFPLLVLTYLLTWNWENKYYASFLYAKLYRSCLKCNMIYLVERKQKKMYSFLFWKKKKKNWGHYKHLILAHWPFDAESESISYKKYNQVISLDNAVSKQKATARECK